MTRRKNPNRWYEIFTKSCVVFELRPIIQPGYGGYVLIRRGIKDVMGKGKSEDKIVAHCETIKDAEFAVRDEGYRPTMRISVNGPPPGSDDADGEKAAKAEKFRRKRIAQFYADYGTKDNPIETIQAEKPFSECQHANTITGVCQLGCVFKEKDGSTTPLTKPGFVKNDNGLLKLCMDCGGLWLFDKWVNNVPDEKVKSTSETDKPEG